MRISLTALPDVLVLEPKRHGDERGLFVEMFKESVFAEAGIAATFIQDNLARSIDRGIVRGLHYQKPPHAQSKLVRCSRGAILDVAVDLRTGSPTFGQSIAVEITEDNWKQLYIPVGFAHGYCTLCDDTEVMYKVSSVYAPESEGGLRWNDPALAIDWPVGGAEAMLNGRDRALPSLAELVADGPIFFT